MAGNRYRPIGTASSSAGNPFENDIELQSQRSRRNSEVLDNINQFNIDDDDILTSGDNPYSTNGSSTHQLNTPQQPQGLLTWRQKLEYILSTPKSKKRIFIITIILLIFWSGLLISFARNGNLSNTDKYLPKVGQGTDAYDDVGQGGNETHSNDGLKKLSLDDQRKGFYYPFPYDLNFVQSDDETDEGYYMHKSGSFQLLKKVSDSSFEQKLYDSNEFEYNGQSFKAGIVSLTKDLKKGILMSDISTVFRHSTTAKYWLYDLESKKVEPVHSVDDENALLSFAFFSPKSNYITFVYRNNLFFKDVKTGETTQVTDDGSDNILNGKPDWVYEEEVLAADGAVYWNSDETQLAYIKFDDTDVPVYELEMFGRDNYPRILNLKYPKAGYPNPEVSIHVYSVADEKTIVVNHADSKLGEGFVIYQIAWISDKELLIKETDRASKMVDVRVFNRDESTSTIVRSINTKDYDGWYVNNGNIFVLPNGKGGYIDSVVDNYFDHLAYFESATSKEPTLLLTSGEFDIIGGIQGYNPDSETVYFIAATDGNAVQRQLYQVSLSEGVESMKSLTDVSKVSAYNVKVSDGGKYALINYLGMDTPNSKLVELAKMETEADYYKNLKAVQDGRLVEKELEGYAKPTKEFIDVTLSDGTITKVLEVRPLNFDSTKKYPLLVSIYGGPGSQKLSADFSYGFEEVVSSSLDSVIWYVEPRGTGSQGWKYKAFAKDQIGYWEPKDIVETSAKLIKEKGYIDTDKTAIWGWSYGGFVTLKTLEYDSGNVFKYGMAVAPVTDWKLYDSIYTERYMDLPENNKNYESSSMVKNYDNFKKVTRFLLMHGTGDDNVHYQNSLRLLNEFNKHTVENYDMRIFPDSNHNINHDNAYTIVYDKLYNWLDDAFQLKFVTLV